MKAIITYKPEGIYIDVGDHRLFAEFRDADQYLLDNEMPASPLCTTIDKELLRAGFKRTGYWSDLGLCSVNPLP